MCKSVFTFQCQHEAVAELCNANACVPKFRPCHCGRFTDRAVVTIICPACALFNQALINAAQLQWLIEQQSNTANNVMHGSYETPPAKPNSQLVPTPVAQKTAETRVESKIPVLQNKTIKPAEADPKPSTYAAAARGKVPYKTPFHRGADQIQSHGGGIGGNWRVQLQREDETKRIGGSTKYGGKKG